MNTNLNHLVQSAEFESCGFHPAFDKNLYSFETAISNNLNTNCGWLFMAYSR